MPPQNCADTVEVKVFARKNGEVPLVTLELKFASVITMIKAPLHLSTLVGSRSHIKLMDITQSTT